MGALRRWNLIVCYTLACVRVCVCVCVVCVHAPCVSTHCKYLCMQMHVYTTFVMFNCTAEGSGYGEEWVWEEEVDVGRREWVWGGGSGCGEEGVGVGRREWVWGGGSGCGEEGVGVGRREWVWGRGNGCGREDREGEDMVRCREGDDVGREEM